MRFRTGNGRFGVDADGGGAKMDRRTLIVLAVALSLVPSVVRAETPAVVDEAALFRDVPSVFGASLYEQKVTEAPSSVSIVTAEEIRKYGYRTLADILRAERSFFITYDRNYAYTGVRGFGPPGDYSTRVLILVDGHRTNDNSYDQALVGTEAPVDVDLIDRVEIIRGPGSSLYGSNAFLAVVNIVTKNGRDLKGAEAAAAASSYQGRYGRVTYGDRIGSGTEDLISASFSSSAGDRLYFPEYDSPATNNGVTEHTDYDRSKSFFAKFTRGEFVATGAYVTRTKGIPTGAFETEFNNSGNKTEDDHGYLDLKYEHGLNARADLTVRLAYDHYRYVGNYWWEAAPGVINKDEGYGDSWSGEARLTQRIADQHRLIVGAEYRANTRQDQKNFDVDPYALYLDDKRRSRVWALYAQDELTLSRMLSITAGIRYDHYSELPGASSPRAALIYTPTERDVVKAMAGTAFRAPNLFELYYQSPGTNEANPDLKPEQITTYEVAYERVLSERLRGTVTAYRYEIDDLIVQTVTGGGATRYENIGETEANGVELAVGGRWPKGFDVKASYAVQRTEYTVTGEPVTNSPAQLAKLNLVVPLLRDRLFAGIEEQYMDRRRTEGGNVAAAYAVTNVTVLAQRLGRHLEASASVYNVFDRRFADPVSQDLRQDTVQQDGRTYRMKLTYAF